MELTTFLAKYALQLNAQQQAAVRQIEGPVLLLAVPGSGKTTVLVTRLGYMLYACKIPPEQILIMTYTVAATKDIRKRFEALFSGEFSEALEFRTINGVCAKIIQFYAYKYDRHPFRLVSTSAETNQIIRFICKSLGVPYPTDLQVKELSGFITYAKNMMLKQDALQEIQVDALDFSDFYKAYCAYMTKMQLMDYDDQMVIAYRILRRYPALLEYFRQKFQYICVDEAQDTSKLQHDLIRLLAGDRQNLFMVGDEDQSIYGFRAAYPQALLAFDEVYPNAKVLLMETNYRSTQEIVTHADAFIAKNLHRHQKHMHTENKRGIPPQRVLVHSYIAQYHYLLKVAENCTQETAVLYRNNDSAIPLIDLLHKNEIPFRARELESYFFSHTVVQDLLECLQFALEPTRQDLWEHQYYKFNTGLKRAQIQHAQAQAGKQGGKTVLESLLLTVPMEDWQKQRILSLQSKYKKIPKMTSFEALSCIINQMGYREYLSNKQGDFTKTHVMLALASANPEITAFLERMTQLKAIIQQGGAENGLFTLSTIHSSKGLEYDRVYLIDVVDGIFPNVEPEKIEDREALEEERRLFYVGVTRAREKLHLLCYEKRYGQPVTSTFMEEYLPQSKKEVPHKAIKQPWSPQQKRMSAEEKNFFPGILVIHRVFGQGMIQSRNGEKIQICFQNGEVKTMQLRICLEQGLLTLASRA